MRELLTRRDFRVLLSAQTLSMLGEWTLLLVFGIWAKTLTGSNAVAGLTVFAMAAPGLLAPLAGVVVDRLPRRWVVIALNATSAVVVSALWLVHDRTQVWVLFAVAAWCGLAGVTRNAAITALVQSMLPAEQVGLANGALATVRQGLRLVGPLLGAGLFAGLGGQWVATVNAAALAASAIILLGLRHREARHQRTEQAFTAELAGGLLHLWAHPLLRRVAVATFVFSAAFGLAEPTVYALVDDGLGRAPDFIGVLVSVQGVGAILGGLAVSAVVSRISEARLIASGLGLLTLGAALCAIPQLPVVLVGFALLGAGLPTMAVATATLLQRLTPAPVMGRVAAGYDMLGTVPTTASIGIGALLVAVLPYQLLMLMVAAGGAGAVIVLWSAVRAPAAVTQPADSEPLAAANATRDAGAGARR